MKWISLILALVLAASFSFAATSPAGCRGEVCSINGDPISPPAPVNPPNSTNNSTSGGGSGGSGGAVIGSYSAVEMKYLALSPSTYRVATSEGDVACGISSSRDWIYRDAKLIEISAGEPIFGGAGDAMSGDYYFDKVLFDPIGLTNRGTILNGTYNQTTNKSAWSPRVFWKMPNRDCWNWNTISWGSVPSIGINGTDSVLMFSAFAPIDNVEKNIIVLAERPYPPFAPQDLLTMAVVEFVAENPSYQTHRFANQNAAPVLYYVRAQPNGNTFSVFEPPFTTEHGSVVKSIGTTEVSMLLAKEIARPSFYFQTSGRNGHAFRTLITDTVDRTLQNRRSDLSEDEWASTLDAADTGGAITSPLRAALPETQTAKNLYRMGANEVSGYADVTVVDNQAPSTSYVEKQSFWAGTTPNGVAYDSASHEIVVNRYSALAYSTKFEGNDYGIPVCTSNLNSSTPDDWTSCGQTSNGRTDSHRVRVKFLGNGNYGILNVGQGLAVGNYRLVLSDISVAVGTENQHPAIIDVRNSNEQVVAQLQIEVGMPYTYTLPNGQPIKISVYNTKPGFTVDSKWAEIGVQFNDEWIISSMQQPWTPLASSTAAINGGTVKLAREKVYGILSPEQILDGGNYKVRLDYVAGSLTPPAVVSILDSNNTVVGQVQIDPGTTYTFTQNGTNNSVKIHVYKTRFRLMSEQGWAEMAIYDEEITLQDGRRFNLVSSSHPDKNAKVSLLWKNRDYTGAGSSEAPDSLREIVVYNTDGVSDKITKDQAPIRLLSSYDATLDYAGIMPVVVPSKAINLELVYPPDNHFTTKRVVPLAYSASSKVAPTLTCKLYLDGRLKSTKLLRSGGRWTYVSGNFAYGKHTWYVSCASGGKTETSGKRTFTILASLPPAANAIEEPAPSCEKADECGSE